MNGGWNISWPTSLAQILSSLGLSLPSVVAMATGLAYLMGFWFLYRAVYKLREYGELRTMMSNNASLVEPLLLMLAGSLLMFLPTAINLTESTFFTSYTPSPIGYAPVSADQRWKALKEIVTMLVRFFGLIAFIRGVAMLPKINSQGGQGGGIGKSLTHIVGGALLMNIHTVVSVLMNTIGGRVV